MVEVGVLMELDYKQLVKGIYPNATIRTIYGSYYKSYWMIHDHEEGKLPALLGYSMESEDAAWEMAFNLVCKRMLGKLAQSYDNNR